MGKLRKIAYSLKDVAVVQAPVSYTNHRSEVDPKINICGRKSYPIFVAPMASVTDENNYNVWIKNGLTPVVPRSVQQRLSFEERMDIAKKTFVSVSLAEAENELYQYLTKEPIAIYYICIDIAHGTLNRLYDICKKLKSEFGDRCVIMTGNIANPKAYSFYADAGIDYVRVSVGTGCFTPNMLVVTKDSLKKISDIKIGDEVLTHTGEYHKVTHIHEFYKKEKLMRINDIECTTNHKFYVVNKTDIENINKDNISEYAYWVSADNLNKEYHMLVKKSNDNMMTLLEINTIEYFDYEGSVYDLTVETDETYNINGIIVHNSRCTSSCNVSVHYPMASLLDELNEERKAYAHSHNGNAPTKLIADGGISWFDDIQKALCLGADAVMCGNLIARSEEACGPIYYAESLEDFMEGNYSTDKWSTFIHPFREYFGMSCKCAQVITGGDGSRTAEGISRPVPVEYPIAKWVDNMQSYLRSCMTYTNSHTIKEMQENAQVVILGGSGDVSYRK